MEDERKLTRDELVAEALDLIQRSKPEDIQKALAAALAIPHGKSA